LQFPDDSFPRLALFLQCVIAGSEQGSTEKPVVGLRELGSTCTAFPWPVIPAGISIDYTPGRDKDVAIGPGIEARGTDSKSVLWAFFSPSRTAAHLQGKGKI
jgi:hypothetical protein